MPSQQKSGEGLRRRVAAVQIGAEASQPPDELAFDLSRLTDAELASIDEREVPDEDQRTRNMIALAERSAEIAARPRYDPAANKGWPDVYYPK